MGNMETADLEYYLLRGGVPPSVASLTGDLSAMEKAIVARVLQSTSPGLTRNLAGSIGEQQQALVDYLFGGVQHSATSSGTGDVEQKINRLLAITGALPTGGGRNLYLPNYFDVFGWVGWLLRTSTSTNTDTRIAHPSWNPYWAGFQATVAGTGTVNYDATMPAPNRMRAVSLDTAALNDRATYTGYRIDGNVRQTGWPWSKLFNSYTKLEWETVCSVSALTGADFFMGWTNGLPYAAGGFSLGVGFQSGETNWSIVANDGAAITKTTIAAIAINTAYKVLMNFDGTTITASIDGGTAATKTTGLPTQANMLTALSYYALLGRSATAVKLGSEWAMERYV